MKVFKILHLGSVYFVEVEKNDVQTFLDMFSLSFNVWDLIDQLQFMNVSFKFFQVV